MQNVLPPLNKKNNPDNILFGVPYPDSIAVGI